jgi:hypothetical protein
VSPDGASSRSVSYHDTRGASDMSQTEHQAEAATSFSGVHNADRMCCAQALALPTAAEAPCTKQYLLNAWSTSCICKVQLWRGQFFPAVHAVCSAGHGSSTCSACPHDTFSTDGHHSELNC